MPRNLCENCCHHWFGGVYDATESHLLFSEESNGITDEYKKQNKTHFEWCLLEDLELVFRLDMDVCRIELSFCLALASALL